LEDRFLEILKGKRTAKERSLFFRDLENDPEKRDAFMVFERLWVLNNMAHKKTSIEYRHKQFRKLWEKAKPGMHLITWQAVSGIAAVALITLIVTVAVFKSYSRLVPETMVLSSPKGNVSTVTLADGSKIWLNSSSEITVKKYGEENVSVDLKGEAFFDVRHDPDRAFVVNVGEYQVYDVGTQFDVEYGSNRDYINISLFEGSVDFRKGNLSLHSELKAGSMLQYDLKKGQLAVKEVEKEFITAWKDGKFIFINRTMADIAKELEEWYDVKFVFRDEQLKKEVFSGIIKRRTNLDYLLRVLRLSGKMKYNIEENEDGSFTVTFQ
jgi:ferric-dicitrate binding protein FerR (iron transport regulator)